MLITYVYSHTLANGQEIFDQYITNMTYVGA
jgi:hypothetical protein